MITDIDDLDSEADLDADICIVGTGVAGLVMAHEFIGLGKKVLVLEAGGHLISDESQQYYQASIVGQPYVGHVEGRFRVFGGTSTRWGGQLLPLDPTDFEMRENVAASGWPLSHQDIEPYYRRALNKFRADELPYDKAIWPRLKLNPLQYDDQVFRYRYSKWIPFKYRNLALAMGDELSSAKNVEVLLHAAVTHVQLDASGRKVDQVSIHTPSGTTRQVRAKQYVLCCGAIETARLLLASNDVNPRGVGNDNDMVGRYFQDHISIECAELKPLTTKQFTDSFSPFFVKDVMHSPRLEIRPEAQTNLGCLSVFGQVLAEAPEDSGFVVVREILRRMQARQKALPSASEMLNVLREIPYMMRLGKCRYLGGKLPFPVNSRWRLAVDVEQEPQRDSRVFLAQERDDLGMPLAVIDWRVGERERATASEFVTHFRREWERLGLGQAIWNKEIFEPGTGWLKFSCDTYHQAGTTRMGQDPSSGVVDRNLRIHGIDNLYVGSTAVFPTSGSANPSFTMAALCLRLADYIRGLE